LRLGLKIRNKFIAVAFILLVGIAILIATRFYFNEETILKPPLEVVVPKRYNLC
jgi:hypothetical protein